jgi:hypothetical protein
MLVRHDNGEVWPGDVLRNNGFLLIGVARAHIFTARMWRGEILRERLFD